MKIVRMTPPCHNRESRKPGAWLRNGHCARTGKPRWRWVRRWFEDRCVTWDGNDIGPTSPEQPRGRAYPLAMGWDCTGCRWLP